MSCSPAIVTPASIFTRRQIGGREPRRLTLSRYVFDFAGDAADLRVDIVDLVRCRSALDE
jgi:hypothetical protein